MTSLRRISPEIFSNDDRLSQKFKFPFSKLLNESSLPLSVSLTGGLTVAQFSKLRISF